MHKTSTLYQIINYIHYLTFLIVKCCIVFDIFNTVDSIVGIIKDVKTHLLYAKNHARDTCIFRAFLDRCNIQAK